MLKVTAEGHYGKPGDSTVRPVFVKAGDQSEQDMPKWLCDFLVDNGHATRLGRKTSSRHSTEDGPREAA